MSFYVLYAAHLCLLMGNALAQSSLTCTAVFQQFCTSDVTDGNMLTCMGPGVGEAPSIVSCGSIYYAIGPDWICCQSSSDAGDAVCKSGVNPVCENSPGANNTSSSSTTDSSAYLSQTGSVQPTITSNALVITTTTSYHSDPTSNQVPGTVTSDSIGAALSSESRSTVSSLTSITNTVASSAETTLAPTLTSSPTPATAPSSTASIQSGTAPLQAYSVSALLAFCAFIESLFML